MARTRIGFRLSEEQKSRWEEHVEESRYYDTLSDFVKHASRQQIERDTGDADASSRPEPGGQAPGEVLDGLQEIRNQLEDLEGEVSHALDAVHGQEGIDPDLPPEVHAALPLGEENAQTVAEIVGDGSRGFSEAQARFALENLVRNLGDVHRTPDSAPGANEEIRWYKVE